MVTTAEPTDAMQPTDNEEDGRSAKDRTFGITEIHEAILIKLDMKTLLFAQRVSRDWQKLIDTSPSLQKKLFMQPATAAETIELGITHGDRNTFLNDDNTFVALNPLFIRMEWSTAYRIDVHSNPLQGNSSWRKMLISQPPLPKECTWWFIDGDDKLMPHISDMNDVPFLGATKDEQVMGDYDPKKEWSANGSLSVMVQRGVRGLFTHDELMKMKDAPPPWGPEFPGYVESKVIEASDIEDEEEVCLYDWDSEEECWF